MRKKRVVGIQAVQGPEFKGLDFGFSCVEVRFKEVRISGFRV